MSTYHFIEEVTRRYLQGETEKTDDADDHPDDSVEVELKKCAKLLVEYKFARDGYRGRNMHVRIGNHGRSRGVSGSTLPIAPDDPDAITPA